VIAVVSYPRLDEVDRQWIESIRAAHDPQATRLGVHFTLVFPVEAPAAAVTAEVSAVAQSTGAIAFTINYAEAVRDVFGGGGHVFLVPDEGLEEIATLHDRLYGGLLRPHLRADIPFTPHMTVAANADLTWCESLAQELNRDRRSIRGTLEGIELVHVDTPRVNSIAAFVLGNSGGTR
jgi:2'-5' RNA ligase